MPFANVKVIEGIFDANERRRIVEKVTDAIVSVAGENLRDKTVVILEEIQSGDWAIGGHVITTEHAQHVRAGHGPK